MVIQPKIRGFICTNAHPVGCEANVQKQIAYVRSRTDFSDGPKNVLVLGCSTGYGLASRLVSAFGYNAKTLGVCFEKPPSATRTGTAGWYNTAAFHKTAQEEGKYARTINGDAFSSGCKAEVIEAIQQDLGQVDLVIYSLASPRRTDPETGKVYKSTLKPVGKTYTTKTFDTDKKRVHDITLEPANDDEIANTIKVMGGEDWELWIKALSEAGVLADGCKTTAYTYIGKELTWPIYGHATIGKAKEDLDRAATGMIEQYASLNLDAKVSSLKALVTQASSAIPVMPLYISLIYKVMKEEGTHEGCIEQISGLYAEKLYTEGAELDETHRYRMDGKETNEATQAKIKALWDQSNNDTFLELSDYAGYHQDFLNLFGFGFEDVDYDADVDSLVDWV